MYSHSVYFYWVSVREEGNREMYWMVKRWGSWGDGRNMRRCHYSQFSQFHVIYFYSTPAASLLAVCLSGTSKLWHTRRYSAGRAEGFARQKHRCQAVGGIPGKKTPGCRIVSRMWKFCIETLLRIWKATLSDFKHTAQLTTFQVICCDRTKILSDLIKYQTSVSFS